MGDGGEEAEVISDAIPFVAEILRLTDPSMMSLELGTLVNNFPDVTRQHLMAILYLRSDVKVIRTSQIRISIPENKRQLWKSATSKLGGLEGTIIFIED